MRRLTLALTGLLTTTLLSAPALAEPTDPVLIGWWSYFDNQKVGTTSSAAHPVGSYGDPDTYYYEPSGAFGMQEDPAVLPPDQAWQSLVSFVLAKANGVSLSSTFSIQTSSDLNSLQEAYYGWALALLYVPKDKYCDSYRVHIGSVDDGVQAMVNGKIVGYANLGEQNKYIDMVTYGSNPPELVLRPGINEVVLIHEDQAAVERYVTNVWIEHDGVQVDLAPKNIAWGRVTDASTAAPIYEAIAGLSGASGNDTFVTGPFGFYFFAGLADGTYTLTADAAGHASATAMTTLALGAGATEAVRTDFALEPGCSCPDGTECGPSGGCLLPCDLQGEFGESCSDPEAVCVNHLCVEKPCDTLTCPVGFECEDVPAADGSSFPVCIEIACSNVCCGDGEVCSGGLCVPDLCGGGCPPGEACAAGTCTDMCELVTCVGNLVCAGGTCIEPCDADPSSCGTGGSLGFGGGGAGPTGSGGDGPASGAGGGNGASPAEDDAGCGCRAAGDERGAATGALGLVAFAALAGVLRRRRVS